LPQFVRVHQTLLNILIGKAGLFETVPFIGAPIAQVLRQVENVVDVSLYLLLPPPPLLHPHRPPIVFVFSLTSYQTIALGLIDTVQSRAADLQNQADSLGMTLNTAIEKYQGITANKKRSLKFARREVAFAA
jgi:hypothetical protein